MGMRLLKRKMPYSHKEISDQIGHISELIRQRDKMKTKEALENQEDAICIAQEILKFMLEENTHVRN